MLGKKKALSTSDSSASSDNDSSDKSSDRSENILIKKEIKENQV